jgi:uncharacterized membrane protein
VIYYRRRKIMFKMTHVIIQIFSLVVVVLVVLAIISVIRYFKSIANRLAAVERKLEIGNEKKDKT